MITSYGEIIFIAFLTSFYFHSFQFNLIPIRLHLYLNQTKRAIKRDQQCAPSYGWLEVGEDRMCCTYRFLLTTKATLLPVRDRMGKGRGSKRVEEVRGGRGGGEGRGKVRG